MLRKNFANVFHFKQAAKQKFLFYLPIFFTLAILDNLLISPIWKNLTGWLLLAAGKPLDSLTNLAAIARAKPWILPCLFLLVLLLLVIAVWEASLWLQQPWSWHLTAVTCLGILILPSLTLFFKTPLLTQNKLLAFLLDHASRQLSLIAGSLILFILVWVAFMHLTRISLKKLFISLAITVVPVMILNCLLLLLQKLFEDPAVLAVTSTLVRLGSQMGLCCFLLCLSPQPQRQALPAYLTPIIMAAALISCLLLSPQPRRQSPLLIAHRGVSRNNGLQNSIPALRKTARMHPNYVEIDVHETKDHQFVVLHDETLQHLAGIKQRPRDLTLKQLEELPVSDRGHKGSLVSFDSYLTAAGKLHQSLLIDLKTTPFDSARMLDRFERKYGYRILAQRDLVQSLDFKAVKKLGRLHPYYLQATNFMLPPKQPAGFSMSYSVLNVSFVTLAQRPVLAWTVDRPLAIKAALADGADGLITDDLPLAKKIADNFVSKYSCSQYLANLIFNPYA